MCDNGPVTRRAEQDSAIGVRDVGEDRAGSAPWVSAIRDRAGRAIRGSARQCHQDQWYGAAQGSAVRVSAMGTAPWGQRTALPSRFMPWGRGGQCIAMCSTAGPSAGGYIPRPHPAAPHAWDRAGDLSVRAGRRRSRRGGVSQRRCGGREASAGLMGCEGGQGGGVGDRREGNASWVALSESCSDLQPGGRCCRRQRQLSPTPPGSRVPV